MQVAGEAQHVGLAVAQRGWQQPRFWGPRRGWYRMVRQGARRPQDLGIYKGVELDLGCDVLVVAQVRSAQLVGQRAELRAGHRSDAGEVSAWAQVAFPAPCD